MSRAELNRLLDDARSRPELLADLRLQLGGNEAARRWAEDHGYELTEEEVEEIRESETELSDDELDQAAGGDWAPGQQPPPPGATGGSGGG